VSPVAATETGLRHFSRVADLGRDDLARVLDLATALKSEGRPYDVLRGQTVACIFEKPSTRTRVSFATAIARLGATPIPLSPQDLQIGRGETIADTARSLSGYCAAIVIRTYAQETVDELARWATVPVINALSDEHHPCQVLADLLTIREAFGDLPGHRLAFIGDGGDNVARSLLEGCALTGLDLTIVCPREYAPDSDAVAAAREVAADVHALVEIRHEPRIGIRGADAVYADVWASMGEEAERERRAEMLRRYQVDADLMTLAGPGAVFLHCLPARRGEEVTADVIDGLQSVVWQQSANRLPTEEALLVFLTGGGAT
jgi:ornithine carbamoyltransferase